MRLFPGSAVEAAALPSKMGLFSWTFVENKEQNGFVVVNFALPGDRKQRRLRILEKSAGRKAAGRKAARLGQSLYNI